MGVDEEGTLAVLKAIRRELADSKVKQHRGRIPGLDPRLSGTVLAFIERPADFC
jgi:hypothetical protein